ncbi:MULTISPECIES: hypothetical protein [unclassified Saccharicrinis]|uniref:hypothetical protein n=1 Tax=unclassified Saccharicrinis TaxID=2646859 RepID=UPI003D3273FA
MSTRNYNYKDVDMLLASKTISQSLISYIDELSVARTTWTIDYANGLSAKIDDAIDNYLGLDKKKELRNATTQLGAIQTPARRDLSFLKTQLEVDFGSEAKEIVKNLGFTKNLKAVQDNNQEALIQLLYTFKQNLTEDLKTQIIEKGTAPALLARMVGYADQMKDANVSQETMKETSKALSEEAIDALNDIYSEIAGICKIAASFYQYEPLKKEQFTISKVVAKMGAAKKNSEEPTEV